MNLKEYQQLAKNTLAQLDSPLMDQLHMVTGLVTESAELADAYKKHFAYGKELDLVNIKEELGDVLWYLANFCTMLNIDTSEIMSSNIAKLKARYPNKFTQEDALNRDLNVERNILEQ